MTQDTRKDRRVKIVSLNVRYKSATVDEFIENHAHDVSRGGIYIKTANPFPAGTLLKFEIRLVSDQAVIAGVGRVVWKREAGTSGGDLPAGMGVKFIKIDEPSKGVIDKLVNTRADAGTAYESEIASLAEAQPAAATAHVNEPKLTPLGGLVAAAPAPAPRKQTMMGLGIVTASSPPPSPGKGSGDGAGMFPAGDSEADMPPKQEQTVMKQAAELLEEALREAGGSMDEIGHNPLFTGNAEPAPQAKARSVPPPAEEAPKRASTPPAADEPSPSDDEAAKARAMVAEMSLAPRKGASDPPRTSRESPGAKRTSAAPAPAADAPAKKSGSGGFVAVFLAVIAVAVVVVMFRDKLFGSNDEPPATPTVVAPTPTPPTLPPMPSAAASAAPSAGTGTPAAASAVATPQASASASAAASTRAAPIATPPKPAAAATARPAATATAAAPATATPTATSTATATPTATATVTATAAPPKPKPAPKPADDNPY